MCLIVLYFAADNVVGFENTEYSVEEMAGNVSVCAVLTEQLGRDIVITFQTVSGTATGMLRV